MIKRFFIILSIAVVAFAILLPTILSTSWVSNRILSRFNSGINGSVVMDSASVSWFGPQRVENLRIKDSKNAQLLTVNSVSTNTSLFSLMLGNKLGPTTLVNLDAHIEQAFHGKTNIQIALEPKGKMDDLNDTKPVVIDVTGVNADFTNQLLKLDGKTIQAGKEGRFNLEWDTSKDLRFLTANVQNLPVVLLDQFVAPGNPALTGVMTALLGDVINLNIQTQNNEIIVKAISQNLMADLQGTIENQQLTLKTPETVALVVTPQLLKYFSEEELLEHPAKAVILIDQLSVPLTDYGRKIQAKFRFDSKNSDPALVQYLGDTEISVSTDTGKQPQFVINSRILQADMSLDLEKKQADGTILLKPDVTLHVTTDWSAKALLLTFKGTELNGTVSIEKDADVNADLKFNKFPIAKTCDLFCTDSLLRKQTRAILGNFVTGALQVKMDQWDGYARTDLEGDNGKIHANGRITHGVLTLNDAFTAQIKVTPLLGTEVLSEAFPILSGIISSDDFVTLQVPPQGTQIQIFPFTLQNMSIGDSTLKLGKLTISSQGDLGEILSLLTKTQGENIIVWFTPLYFNMQEGQININRMDMLIMDEYPIATWGKVNFPKDRVQMMIGFTPRAIEKAFKLEGLPTDYLLQIELKGTINNASVNRSKALAKISSLVASTQGVEGMIVGSVIDIASGSLSDPAPPAPTTTPLPWETAGVNKSGGKKAKQKKLQNAILEKINPIK